MEATPSRSTPYTHYRELHYAPLNKCKKEGAEGPDEEEEEDRSQLLYVDPGSLSLAGIR
jgi:hypothetical protein